MKHRNVMATGTVATSLLVSSSAYAHAGDHGEHILSMALHWLASPSHSLFAVISGAIFVILAYKMTRRSKI